MFFFVCFFKRYFVLSQVNETRNKQELNRFGKSNIIITIHRHFLIIVMNKLCTDLLVVIFVVFDNNIIQCLRIALDDLQDFHGF